MNVSVLGSALMQMVFFIRLVCVGSRLGVRLTFLDMIGQQLNTNNTCTTKIARGGGLEQLRCTRCSKLFHMVRARAAHESACSFFLQMLTQGKVTFPKSRLAPAEKCEDTSPISRKKMRRILSRLWLSRFFRRRFFTATICRGGHD